MTILTSLKVRFFKPLPGWISVDLSIVERLIAEVDVAADNAAK
jgi:hypothetical protein